jgi:NhaA family Na+:H+ antiporter
MNAPPRSRVLFAIVAPFQSFFRLEAAGGLVMIANAVLALLWANSALRGLYEAIFHATVELTLADRGIRWTVHHFTNDALMTLFFVVAGLEIKRELALGELRTVSRAALPLVAAMGGMLVPALIYLALNPSGPGRAGWGVPMATDIAFALGCLSLVRRRVPSSVFVFLTALAIFDDLGAIVVIALFYGGRVDPQYLVVALGLSGVLILLGRARVQAVWPFAVVGVLLWIAVLRSGLHATIAGVITGLAMPTTPRRAAIDVVDDLDVATTSLRRDCERRGFAPDGAVAAIERHLESVQSPLDRAMHGLHGVVAFGVVPLFALANAGLSLRGVTVGSVGLGAFLGLVIGKPIGVFGATWIATRVGLAPRPTGATWTQLFAASLMAGIGFTMSLFVGNLGLGAVRALEDQAKLGVLAASLVAALLGILLLRWKSPILSVEEEGDMPVVLDVPRFARGYAVRPCGVSTALSGRTLAELDARRRFGVTVIGVWRGDQEGGARKLEAIAADQRMSEGEVLLAAGPEEAVDAFLRFAQGAEKPPGPSEPAPEGGG